jgi:small subunit ribosomal protein S20
VPRIASAKKRMRQANRRRTRNRAQRSAVRRAMKQVRTASTAEAAQNAMKAAERLLDRAARKGLIKSNAAARHKRRLVRVARGKG